MQSASPSPIDAILGQVNLSQATLEIHSALNALEELRVYALSLEAALRRDEAPVEGS